LKLRIENPDPDPDPVDRLPRPGHIVKRNKFMTTLFSDMKILRS